MRGVKIGFVALIVIVLLVLVEAVNQIPSSTTLSAPGPLNNDANADAGTQRTTSMPVTKPFFAQITVPPKFQGNVIIAQTNLPTGTATMVSLRRPPPDCRPNCGYVMEEESVVNNGQIKIGPFDLIPGRYLLEVTTPLTELQPKNVEAVFGELGRNLRGSLVQHELIPGGGPTLAYSAVVTIDSGSAGPPTSDVASVADDVGDRDYVVRQLSEADESYCNQPYVIARIQESAENALDGPAEVTHIHAGESFCWSNAANQCPGPDPTKHVCHAILESPGSAGSIPGTFHVDENSPTSTRFVSDEQQKRNGFD